jgi:hypothetical protein
LKAIGLLPGQIGQDDGQAGVYYLGG